MGIPEWTIYSDLGAQDGPEAPKHYGFPSILTCEATNRPNQNAKC